MLKADSLELTTVCDVFSWGLFELMHYVCCRSWEMFLSLSAEVGRGSMEVLSGKGSTWFGRLQFDLSFTRILPLSQFHLAGEKCPVCTPRLRTHGESRPPHLPWSTMAQQRGGSLLAVAVDGIILLSQWCHLEEPMLLLLPQPCANQVR